MLQNELFTFTDLQAEEGTITTNVWLNPAHPIFKGHFPGMPVLPGVCMMQMAKELLDLHLKKQTRLVKASDLKFLSIITPDRDKALQLKLNITFVDESIRVDAFLSGEATVLFKFKGFFQEKH